MGRKDATKVASSYLDNLEARLRESLHRHWDHLVQLTVPESTSRAAFASKIVELVAETDACYPSYSAAKSTVFIKIAALDVDLEAVCAVLRSQASVPRLQSFWASMGETPPAISEFSGKIVKRPHVTMAHFLQMEQATMRGFFEPLCGSIVKLTASALLWSDRVAALEVNLPKATLTGKEVPQPQNSFPHVTVWVHSSATPAESNELPLQCQLGMAKRVAFEEPIELSGTVSLWTGR